MTEAARLISQLRLEPHPEGGHYREIHRSALTVQVADSRPARDALTTIYYLLQAGDYSGFHVVRSDEVWNHCAGAELELVQMPAGLDDAVRLRLGQLGSGAVPVHVVPAGAWQAARPRGDFTLVTCTVGPGFDFADFSMMRNDPALSARLRIEQPDLVALL